MTAAIEVYNFSLKPISNYISDNAEAYTVGKFYITDKNLLDSLLLLNELRAMFLFLIAHFIVSTLLFYFDKWLLKNKNINIKSDKFYLPLIGNVFLELPRILKLVVYFKILTVGFYFLFKGWLL